MTSTTGQVTYDCRDPYVLATFWAAALGGRLGEGAAPDDPEVLVRHHGTPLLFIRVPEAKTVKNRVHLDLVPDTTRGQEVERLVGLGARVLDDRTNPDGTGWVVLADPEGNELCVERSLAERGREPVTENRPMPADRTADERTTLTQMLDWYRAGVLAKADGLAQDLAVASPVRTGITVAGLVRHLAGVEDSWFTHGLADRPMPEPWGSEPPEDPDWDWHSANDAPLEESLALYRTACDRSREVTAALTLDDTGTNRHGNEFSLRWVLVHLVEETARHLGHLDILRELADGRTGD